jgi:competence protein ComEA
MVTSRELLARRGWELKYVPHEEIAKYNACYRVSLDGELIYPPAADDLGIPRDEIWISERWRKYERFILFHELREIEHRAAGCDVTEAHERAEADERAQWQSNPRWRVMNAEWDEGRAHLPRPHEEV